jgi:hypothetical protein
MWVPPEISEAAALGAIDKQVSMVLQSLESFRGRIIKTYTITARDMGTHSGIGVINISDIVKQRPILSTNQRPIFSTLSAF